MATTAVAPSQPSVIVERLTRRPRTYASSAGSSASPSRPNRRTTTSTDTPTIAASAAVWVVSRNWGMIGGQACDPGLALSTPTNPHRGRSRIQKVAGPTIATAAARRASSQVRHDAPCHSSARK